MWGLWGSYYNIPKAIFYLLKGDYRVYGSGAKVWGVGVRVEIEGWGFRIKIAG